MATLLYRSITGIPALVVIPDKSHSLYVIYNIPIQLQTISTSDVTHIVCGCISPTGRILAFVTQGKRLDVYKFEEDNGWIMSYSKLIPFKSSIQSICITNSENDLLLADKSGCVCSFQIKDSGEEICNFSSLLGHCSMLTCVKTSVNDKYIITADSEGKLRVSNYPNAYNIHSFLLSHTEFVTHISFLPDYPNRILSGAGDGTIKLWDFENSLLLSTLTISNTPVYLLDVSSQGIIVVAVEGKNMLYFLTIQENTIMLLHTIELQAQPYSGCFGLNNICWISTYESFHAFTITTEPKFNELSVSDNPCLLYLSKHTDWCQIKKSEESKYSILKKRTFTHENKYYEHKQEWIEAKKRKIQSSHTPEPERPYNM
ncbi:tRNA (guanine-N(7)-)-methyltransferase non-catalytic subunit WDR4-like isoform X3 [Oopsacas minuta]|uniref:tRNA (guanine-N(7)-)-methyltransferase non-catalytic subunit n=1 Tax=Oopsacas minuta TaxID=111878 RepID=A0AAV7JTH8_9METZ|nr:tRNA (guanine-N(7)-)-methyltransferase non-catalytic subunit WDR4-like isoform X3 [Oopsacas minuta]